MPVGLAVKFTVAEQAVLGVIADEVQKHGRCDLFIGHIAALAGVSETVVRNALREAKGLGLVAVEIRRVQIGVGLGHLHHKRDLPARPDVGVLEPRSDHTTDTLYVLPDDRFHA